MKSSTNHQHPTIPDNFKFNQGSLQAYVDCPRLFQLRYIERLSWPAPEAEPSIENEHYIQLGSSFHQLVQQYYLGVDQDRLRDMARRDSLLTHWWENFLAHKPDSQNDIEHTEISMSTPVDQYRLVAKYDLIVIKDKTPLVRAGSSLSHPNDFGEVLRNAVIFDWKTSRKPPERKWQASKLQTRVYPYVLIKAGSYFHGGKPFNPDQIEMVYWFSNFPTAPIRFRYSPEEFEKDEEYILGLVNDIKKIGDEEAKKTENQKRCSYCVYRSLCNRGVKAGLLHEFLEAAELHDETDDLGFDLGLDQIAEIEF
jgi:hypothetical protein